MLLFLVFSCAACRRAAWPVRYPMVESCQERAGATHPPWLRQRLSPKAGQTELQWLGRQRQQVQQRVQLRERLRGGLPPRRQQAPDTSTTPTQGPTAQETRGSRRGQAEEILIRRRIFRRIFLQIPRHQESQVGWCSCSSRFLKLWKAPKSMDKRNYHFVSGYGFRISTEINP